MSWSVFGAMAGIAVIIYGIVLRIGNIEFLSRSRFVNGLNGRGSSSLKLYRLAGMQHILMGATLLISILGFMLSITWLAFGAGLVTVLMPLPFSIYMKKSKKFNQRDAGHTPRPPA